MKYKIWNQFSYLYTLYFSFPLCTLSRLGFGHLYAISDIFMQFHGSGVSFRHFGHFDSHLRVIILEIWTGSQLTFSSTSQGYHFNFQITVNGFDLELKFHNWSSRFTFGAHVSQLKIMISIWS